MASQSVIWLPDLSLQDIDKVGGKNASLGEMIQHLAKLEIKVPQGFATTAELYRAFLAQNDLDQRIYALLKTLQSENLPQLTKVGKTIREWILEQSFPAEGEASIRTAYKALECKITGPFSVAVRSSATAEDLPQASFAGQQETFLNISGIEEVLVAIKRVYASLFNDRAISYRIHQNFPHETVALSVGVQQMIRSDEGSSGVMFTLDTESGFSEVILITSSYGLGEPLVQGTVNPDEFYVSKSALLNQKRAVIAKKLGSKTQKMIYGTENTLQSAVKIVPVSAEEQRLFSLTELEIEKLARLGLLIEKHYKCPMDIEWAKDGRTQEIYIVQARPETVSHHTGTRLERYVLKEKGKVLLEGRSVGQKIGQGSVVVMNSIKEMAELKPHDILVTDMTDPDWEPIMKRVAAVVTNRGGRTCHAAILARELGIPAVVGCGNATQLLKTGQPVTVSCAEGDRGYVYNGLLKYEVNTTDLSLIPELPIKIRLIVGNPERAFSFARLPNEGIGLARLEFIINQTIGIHPKACLEFNRLSPELQQQIAVRIAGYNTPIEYYIAKLSEGIATLGTAFWPKPVVVRLSDFKSNEYANLLGGREFEPVEENPMLGFRGACRYLSDSFAECFAMECKALKTVREDYGLTNIEIMIPFIRTPEELKSVVEKLAQYGLRRGENGLKIIMMCELPANALLADAFLAHVDGFSIGSNDLTQLTLGVDRDSGLVAPLFDERNAAVKALLKMAISACKKHNKSISICGQGPSDHLDFAKWLIQEGIESISLNPDSVLQTWLDLAG